MKTLPSALQTHLQQPVTTLALLLLFIRGDGERFAFTSHDRAVTCGADTYLPVNTVELSPMGGNTGTSADSADASGAWALDGISEVDLEAGRWDAAAWELRICSWEAPATTAYLLRRGELGRVRKNGRAYAAELLTLGMRLQRTVGRRAVPMCDAILGDARCGVNMAGYTYAVAVTAVASRSVFTCAALLGETNQRFIYGTVEFTSGDNAGWRAEIVDYNLTTAELRLIIDPPFAVAVGDTVTVTNGCNKIARSNEGTGEFGDCAETYGNLVNFRGLPDVPGERALLGALESSE